MSGSVARQVALSGAAVLVVTLAVVGVGTAALVHASRARALDEALLAAAHGRAHPEVSAEIEVEHSRSPIDAWLVQGDDPRVPGSLRARARERERPVYADVGDRRLVLLPFEVLVEQGRDEHRIAAAAAPRLTLARSVGTFALVYALVGGTAALFATVTLRALVRAAFHPLDRARDETSRVMRLGEGARLPEDGPLEIRSLLAAMNELLERLGRAQEAQARFTAEAAHELRTPVTALLGELDVTLRTAGTVEECRAALSSMREDVERLRRLVDALTALARIDAGQIERGRELVRAGELASSAFSAEAGTLAAAGCKPRLELADDPELTAHRALVEIALANLLRNAARHAPGGHVVLRVRREGANAIFEVDDGGPGIPPEQREALFDRFARSGEARRRDPGGLGLGLPIAREVARRHGGDCVLEAAPGGGLRARIALPGEPSLS